MRMRQSNFETESRRAARRRDGFSLVEVMIAMFIMSIGILGTTAAQINAIRMSSNSRANGLALSLAETQLGQFQSTTMADLLTEVAVAPDPGNPIMVDPGGGVQIPFQRSWVIEANQPIAGMARIAISVTWQSPDGSVRTARVQGLKAG